MVGPNWMSHHVPPQTWASDGGLHKVQLPRPEHGRACVKRTTMENSSQPGLKTMPKALTSSPKRLVLGHLGARETSWDQGLA